MTRCKKRVRRADTGPGTNLQGIAGAVQRGRSIVVGVEEIIPQPAKTTRLYPVTFLRPSSDCPTTRLAESIVRTFGLGCSSNVSHWGRSRRPRRSPRLLSGWRLEGSYATRPFVRTVYLTTEPQGYRSLSLLSYHRDDHMTLLMSCFDVSVRLGSLF
jgi:hypothetical protein